MDSLMAGRQIFGSVELLPGQVTRGENHED